MILEYVRTDGTQIKFTIQEGGRMNLKEKIEKTLYYTDYTTNNGMMADKILALIEEDRKDVDMKDLREKVTKAVMDQLDPINSPFNEVDDIIEAVVIALEEDRKEEREKAELLDDWCSGNPLRAKLPMQIQEWKEKAEKWDNLMPINIVFARDNLGSPDLLFVEVETEDGKSISVGEWSSQGNYHILKIPSKIESGAILMLKDMLHLVIEETPEWRRRFLFKTLTKSHSLSQQSWRG